MAKVRCQNCNKVLFKGELLKSTQVLCECGHIENIQAAKPKTMTYEIGSANGKMAYITVPVPTR